MKISLNQPNMDTSGAVVFTLRSDFFSMEIHNRYTLFILKFNVILLHCDYANWRARMRLGTFYIIGIHPQPVQRSFSVRKKMCSVTLNRGAVKRTNLKWSMECRNVIQLATLFL